MTDGRGPTGESRPVFFVTIDTEEDEWGAYHLRTPAVTNVVALQEFQELCDRYAAVPTYLTNWPVAANTSSACVLEELLAGGRCEIGTHIHPWNTPPFEEVPGPRNSWLCNLPRELVQAKLSRLHAELTDRFGVEPRSFRTGRWGFGPDVAGVLHELGYEVDSSVSPYIDWSPELGPDYSHAPRTTYRFRPSAPLVPEPGGALRQVPVTVGFFGARGRSGQRIRSWAGKPLLRQLQMVGVVDRIGLAARRWLSPELSTGPDMVRLARDLVAAGVSHLNFTFHSPSLVPGLSPFVRNERELSTFKDRIEEVLDHAKSSGYRFARLADAPRLFDTET